MPGIMDEEEDRVGLRVSGPSLLPPLAETEMFHGVTVLWSDMVEVEDCVVVLTEKEIRWRKDRARDGDSAGVSGMVKIEDVVLHGIVRGSEEERPGVYCQIQRQELGAERNENEENVSELRLIPCDEDWVDRMFDALCRRVVLVGEIEDDEEVAEAAMLGAGIGMSMEAHGTMERLDGLLLEEPGMDEQYGDAEEEG